MTTPLRFGLLLFPRLTQLDMTGPFDYHLTRRLIQICQEFGIRHQRDLFRFYRSDSAAALKSRPSVAMNGSR